MQIQAKAIELAQAQADLAAAQVKAVRVVGIGSAGNGSINHTACVMWVVVTLWQSQCYLF